MVDPTLATTTIRAAYEDASGALWIGTHYGLERAVGNVVTHFHAQDGMPEVEVNAIAPVARTRLTEQVAGDFMNAKEGEFDRFAPENISAVVAWLASDLSDGVTGQVVKVMGGQVQLLRGWRPVSDSLSDKP